MIQNGRVQQICTDVSVPYAIGAAALVAFLGTVPIVTAIVLARRMRARTASASR